MPRQDRELLACMITCYVPCILSLRFPPGLPRWDRKWPLPIHRSGRSASAGLIPGEPAVFKILIDSLIPPGQARGGDLEEDRPRDVASNCWLHRGKPGGS
jgi:hypothetical protein